MLCHTIHFSLSPKKKNFNFRPLDCVQLNIINADMIHQEINKTNENEMYYKSRELETLPDCVKNIQR